MQHFRHLLASLGSCARGDPEHQDWMSGPWRARMRTLQALRGHPAPATAVLSSGALEWLEAASASAEKLEKAWSAAQRAAFREWAARASEKGAGPAHRFSKVPAAVADEVAIQCDDGFTLEPQKLVERELASWEKVWELGEDDRGPGGESEVPKLTPKKWSSRGK